MFNAGKDNAKRREKRGGEGDAALLDGEWKARASAAAKCQQDPRS